MKNEAFDSIFRESGNIKNIKDLVLLVRANIQFNDCPDYDDLLAGEMDCVGVSYLVKELIKKIFSFTRVEVVALPFLPWTGYDMSHSKHTAVVVFEKAGIIFVDATPINGYGYGMISEVIPYSSWEINDREWRLKNGPTSLMESVDFWDRNIYGYFKVIDDDDAESIYYINHLRATFNKNSSLVVKDILPTNHGAWNKEYWRMKAKFSLKDMRKDDAIDFYKQSLEIDPNDPYVLAELASLLPESESGAVYQRHSVVTAKLVNNHQAIIELWRKRLAVLYANGNWKEYLRYLGMIFWREQSLRYFSGLFPASFEVINFRGLNLPIYRFSPAWFKKNKLGVRIYYSTEAELEGLRSGETNHELIPIYEEVFKLKGIPKNIVVGIINSNCEIEVVGNGCFSTYDPILSHYWYVGVLNPELIII